MKYYVKVQNGYIVAEYDDIQKWRLEITEDVAKYHMEHLIEERAQKIRTSMENEEFELISDEQYKRNPMSAMEREMEGLRVLCFAKKGKWRFATEKEIETAGYVEINLK